MFKLVNECWFPETDNRAHNAVFDVRALIMADELCKQKRTAIQAGANVGVWPAWLGERFKTVYTAEPDLLNFMCLTQNVKWANVYKLQCAFGFNRGPMGFQGNAENCGSGYMTPSGNIPVIRIDDLGLSDVDLIALDVEGMEADALKGAELTLDRCHPVVLFEDKHSDRYGHAPGFVGKYLEHWGYKEAASYARDRIYV